MTKENNAYVPINISFSDLEALSSHIEDKGLDWVLNSLGFDLTYQLERLECTHKNRLGKIVEGVLYIGRERLDKLWLNSSYASDEAKIAARNDLSYNREIAKLSRRL